jgi:hypothetical protein
VYQVGGDFEYSITLIFICSFSSIGCGRPGIPGIYTDVYYFIKNGWLCNILGNNVDNACQDEYEEI